MNTDPQTVLTIQELNKVYASGLTALSNINLSINKGEIFALLGPNGAGKTTLISTVCGIVRPTSGSIHAAGYDIIRDYREARARIGLVPQEIHTDAFETVWDTVSFSRGLFGAKKSPARVEEVLRDLSLWDKKSSRIRTLSGGMKRRVMIAKALVHDPVLLFLDEPTAGVDVDLRKDMWRLVRRLRDKGVTIILTTHYITEAEEMADRIGVIQKGKLIVVEEKKTLMKKLGKRLLQITLKEPLASIPVSLLPWAPTLSENNTCLNFSFDASLGGLGGEMSIQVIMKEIHEQNIAYTDLATKDSSLEEIFVNLIHSSEPS